MSVRHVGRLVITLAWCVVALPLGAQHAVAADDRTSNLETRVSEVLARPITVQLDRVSLKQAVRAIGASAGVVIQFQGELLDAVSTRVSLHATRMRLGDALDTVLRGTNLRATPLAPDVVTIKQIADRDQDAQGTISGRVVDAETKRPIHGASVMLDDNRKTTVRTSEAGQYRFLDVGAGSHHVTVRSVGYAQQRIAVTVTDGRATTADVALEPSGTILDQVVVTATGEQRVRELGHVVARINADSLVREAPITSLTELLQSRVPGLSVLTGSGGVAGGATALRLRGTTTRSLDPEPIVIVDGVRYKSNNYVPNTDGSMGLDNAQGPLDLRSPLTDLNPNDVESVEIVKGPSASTLYGQDAANGVIIITTKRGKAGKPQFRWYARPVTNSVPKERIARAYQAWGHDPVTLKTVNFNCTLLDQYYYKNCIQDSITVTTTAAGSDDRSVIAKSRPTWQYGSSVSGGSSTMRYFVSGNYDSEIGAIQMPKAARQYFEQALGTAALSHAIQNPNTMQSIGTNANVTVDVTPTTSVGVTAMYTRNTQTRFDVGAFTNGYHSATSPVVDTSNVNSYLNTEAFFLSTADQTDRFTGSIYGNTKVTPWLTATATFGLDLDAGTMHGVRPSGVPNANQQGYAQEARRANANRNASLGAVATARADRLSFRSSLGVQYTYSHLDGLNAYGSGLAPGSLSIATALYQSISPMWSEVATLGSYGEEVVGLNDRLFLTGSLRLDGSTSFGDAYRARPYPKVGASWIASDEPFLRGVPGLHELRFRFSYGAASRYPTSIMKSGNVYADVVSIYGKTAQEFVRDRLANPDLQPERSQEAEYGADATIFSDIQLGLTWYNRHTHDQLQFVQNPTGLPPIWSNGASVAAHGFEATVQVPLVVTTSVRADVAFNYAYRTDKITSLGGLPPRQTAAQTGYEVGYPLDAVFGKRILAVLDTVGGPDGIAFPQEVVRDSVARFLGVVTPPRTYTITPSVSLLQGHVRLSALFDRETGFLITSQDYLACGEFGGLCLAPFVKTTPLLEQAKYLSNQVQDYLERGDFTRWREFNVTVDLPDRFARAIHFAHSSVSLQGRNLKLWTGYSGTDPESRNGGNFTSAIIDGIPQARAWSVRFDVTP